MPDSRYQLLLSKVEDFAQWAMAQGFTREPALARVSEVLRLRWEKEPPLIFYSNKGSPYVSIPLASHRAGGFRRTVTHAGLVTRWLRTQNNTPTTETSAT